MVWQVAHTSGLRAGIFSLPAKGFGLYRPYGAFRNCSRPIVTQGFRPGLLLYSAPTGLAHSLLCVKSRSNNPAPEARQKLGQLATASWVRPKENNHPRKRMKPRRGETKQKPRAEALGKRKQTPFIRCFEPRRGDTNLCGV
jgi:hypothetical protein